jgi:hypothetical protein
LGANGFRRRDRLAEGGARAAAEPRAEQDVDLAAPAHKSVGADQIAAHRRDVPYQSLIKMWLAEKVDAAMPE